MWSDGWMDGWIGGGSWGAAELLLVSDSHLGVAHNTLVVRWIPRKSLLKCFATIFESATLKKKLCVENGMKVANFHE